jgi:uracil-DNA glycosylase family 4
MPIQVRPSGPTDARVMIVGEAPGAEEERKGEPFVGASGHELTKMLHEAGIARSQCFITNVCRERPPGNHTGPHTGSWKMGASATQAWI